MKTRNQQGFSVVSLTLFMVILGLVGVIGWRVLDVQRNLSATKQSNSQSTAQTATQPQVQQIKSKSDVAQAQSTLDSASIDSDLNSSSLDRDLNSLL